MMGLRPENDQASTSFFSSSSTNRKTYRFAERYSGRFFVSGVSGSFAKYSKQLKETDKKYLRQEKKYVHEPVLEKHQKEELRRDAQRLVEMEEQLQQLQRMRELKRQRDRARRKKKLEYMSACCIQRCVRQFIQHRKDKSANILKTVLRAVAAQHALSAALWACSVLKRFAIRSSYIWKERQFQRRIARRTARESWRVVQSVACVYTVARRAVTDELVFNCVKLGTQRATKTLLEAAAIIRPKKMRRKSVHKRSSKHKSSKVNSDSKASKNTQFFLTEFDMPDCSLSGEESVGTAGEDSLCGTASEGAASRGRGAEMGSDYDDEDLQLEHMRRSQRLHGKERCSAEDLTASALNSLRLSKRQVPAKVYDPSNAEHRRIMELHKKRQDEVAQERARRKVLVDQRKEAEQKAALARKLSEEQLKQSAEAHKREYQAQLALEDRAKARMMAKVRADREAARLKKEAAERLQERERSTMQLHDKPCYQAPPSSGAVKSRHSASISRPVSALRSAGAAAVNAGGTDWAVVADTAAGDPSSNPVVVPKPAVRVAKAPAVLDQAQLDAEYYQRALPPKRPGVPRMAPTGDAAAAVSQAKKKKDEELAAIEKEAQTQLEVRRAKYTSEEAVRRSRLAVKRRVAAKLERQAQKQKEQEESEQEKREKMQKIADLAAQKLKRDLEKKKRRETERRRALGIDTHPDPYALSSIGPARRKRRLGGKGTQSGVSESETSASEAELGSTAAGQLPGSTSRYKNAEATDCDEEKEEVGSEQEGDWEQQLEQYEQEDEDAECVGDIGEEEGKEEQQGGDSDSLDEMLAGITRTLRQQSNNTAALAPQRNPSCSDSSPLQISVSSKPASTRSSSAGANEPTAPKSITRNTLSGGGDTRQLMNSALYSPAPNSSHSRDEPRTAFERADISSAHEHFDDLMENFGAEDFLQQRSVMQLLRTNTSGKLVEGLGEVVPPGQDSERSGGATGRSGANKKVRAKLNTGAVAKKVVIPKHLQNTPYFQSYKKHSNMAETKSSTQLQPSSGVDDTTGAAIGSHKTGKTGGSKLPLLARKQQLAASEGAQAVMGSSASAPNVTAMQLDEDLVQFQQSQNMKPGKVASLLEMVSRARTKLHKHSSSENGVIGAQSGTDVSDVEHANNSEQELIGAKMPSFTGAAGAFATPTSATTSGSAPSDSVGVSFKPASDAELDAMVPSLQPPSVPQSLPLASFSRKMQANIPLPPLSKDNLTILLKGKHPDSFLASAAAPSGKAGAGVSTKGSKKPSNSSKTKTKKAAAVAPPPKAPVPVMNRKEKAPSKKSSITALSANIVRNRTVSNARYAYTEGDDSDEYDESEFENADLYREHQYSEDQARSGMVRFALEAEDSGDGDADENESLEQEYSRLREEFNAKLQQAAAVTSSQTRASIDSSYSVRADSPRAGEHEEQAGEEDGDAEVEASGHLTQSYAQGHEKISTQDLLRMWELEDAAEEERQRSAQQQKSEPPAVVSASSHQQALPTSSRNSIAVMKDNHSPTAPPRQQHRHRYSRNSGYCEESSDEADGDSSEGEQRVAHQSTDQRSTSQHSSEPSTAAGVPIPANTVQIDDTALDEECLNFLSKMSSKIQQH